MTTGRLRVAVVGTGSWAQRAHLPGWQRDGRAEVVAVADTNAAALAQAAADVRGAEGPWPDYRELLEDPDIDVIDVVTGNRPHYQVSWDALQAGKHVLCEKPVHPDYRKTREAAELAAAKGLKTKVGFTFRYAPAVQFARRLIDEGYVGEPYMFNGYEQNSQWIDPATPLRQVDPNADPERLAVSSIEGYGAPIIDIMHWWLGAPLQAVVGTMRNFVPVSMVRDTGQMTRANIDDGDMWIAEFAVRCAGLDPVLVRHGRQLPGHRGADLRLGGRDHRQARRRVRHLPDDQDGAQGCRRVRRAGHPASLLPGGRPLRRAVGVPVLLQPHLGLHFRDRRRQPGLPGRLRAGGARAGDHQRVRGLLPSAGLGQLPARRRRRPRPRHALRGRMKAATNASRLVSQVLTGEVWPALADRHGYRVGPDGQPFVLPGMGGVTLGVHCGDPATGYASDHLEPGASIRHADPAANMAVQFLSCVGNEVTVTAGPAAGATGHVIGQHAYVLVDFTEAEAAELTTGDAVSITAVGQGLRLTEHPSIVVKNCSPGLIAAMPGGTDGGRQARGARRGADPGRGDRARASA